MAAEWWQSRRERTVHTRNCRLLESVDGGRGSTRSTLARCARTLLRDTSTYPDWWPSSGLTVEPLRSPDEDQRRIRVCSKLGACWEGKVIRDVERDGDGLEMELQYDGVFRGRGVWSISRAPSLASCMHSRGGDTQERTVVYSGVPKDAEQRSGWYVCYQADLKANGRALLAMGLGMDIARLQSVGTDEVISALFDLAEANISQE